jgi:hypothetical protein
MNFQTFQGSNKVRYSFYSIQLFLVFLKKIKKNYENFSLWRKLSKTPLIKLATYAASLFENGK